MASTSETGHKKNISHFSQLIQFCQSYGATYNPSKNSLKIPQLQTQLTSVETNFDAVNTTNVAFKIAENNRIDAFKDLKKLGTRLVGALDVTDASKQLVKDAKTVNAKLQGGKLTKADAGKTANPEVLNTTSKTISNSQQSYDNLIDHFSKLIAILATEPTYIPNETELQLTTLNTQLTNLKNLNNAVANAYTTVSNARIARNNSMYNPTVGMCQVAKEVKAYVKSVFGATSPQFKQVNKLEFKTIKS